MVTVAKLHFFFFFFLLIWFIEIKKKNYSIYIVYAPIQVYGENVFSLKFRVKNNCFNKINGIW